MQDNLSKYSLNRYTIDEIVDMMVMDGDGKMEFPRDLMMQDCLANQVEPLFGFVTNVTLKSDQPCIQDVECTANGTTIDSEDDILTDFGDLLLDTDETKSVNKTTPSVSRNVEMSPLSDHDIQSPVKSEFSSSRSLLRNIRLDNTTLAIDNRDQFLSNERISFSDPEISSSIDYTFGEEYLATYRQKGRYQVKHVVPRLAWDQPHVSIAQDRSDVNYGGN